MKKFYLLVFSLATLGAGVMFAQKTSTTNPDNKPKTDREVVLYKGVASNRPRVPSNQGISCWYGEGFLTVSFPDNTNFMEVVVADEEESVVCADVIYPESPTVILPPSTGASLSVTCTTDLGAVYSGWIEY